MKDIKETAKKIKEKAKAAASDVASKAKTASEDIGQKVKDVDVEKLKGDVTGEDGKISVDKIKGLDTSKKAILGGGFLVVLVILYFVFSGGSSSYSLKNLSKAFPLDGSIAERCEQSVYLEYNYRNLVNDGVKGSEIIDALEKTYVNFDRSKVEKMSSLEKSYYRNVAGLKRHAAGVEESDAGNVKEKLLSTERYDAAYESCLLTTKA